MHRNRLALSVCTSVLLALQGCSEGGGNNSQSAPDARAEFGRAADALVAKVGSPGEKAEMPPASDPAVQAFETQSANALKTLGTDALPVEGFESYQDLCGKAATIVGAYAMAGTSGTTGAAQQQKMEQNVARHMDQMFTPLLFSAHCNAVHMPFLEGELDGSEGKQAEAVKQVREGVFGQVVGLVQMASDTSLQPERRRRIVELLADDAPKFAIGLSQAQRQQVLQAAQEMRSTLPEELRGQADKFTSGIQSAKCEKICSLA